MKVRPYCMTWSERRSIVFGPTALVALESFLRTRQHMPFRHYQAFKVLTSTPALGKHLDRFLAEHQPELLPAQPYLIQRDSIYQAVFHHSMAELQEQHPGYHVHVCDPLHPLRQASGETLLAWARMIWCNRKTDTVGMWEILPVVQRQQQQVHDGRIRRRRRQRAVEQWRLAMVHAIRLAMVLDSFPAQYPATGQHVLRDLVEQDNICFPDENRIRRFFAIHEPNIGQRATEELFQSLGTDLDNHPRNHPRVLHIACKMARLYGYHPEKLRYNELAALYRAGIPGLKQEQADHQLHIDDQWTEKFRTQ